MNIVYYDLILDALFVVESGEQESLIFFYVMTEKSKNQWICLGEL
jgi:hypothetical protein